MICVSEKEMLKMTDNTLTPDELKTLALFSSDQQQAEIEPHHFAKLLSMAFVVQREGGPELTPTGLDYLREHFPLGNIPD